MDAIILKKSFRKCILPKNAILFPIRKKKKREINTYAEAINHIPEYHSRRENNFLNRISCYRGVYYIFLWNLDTSNRVHANILDNLLNIL